MSIDEEIAIAQKNYADACFEYRVITPDIPWELFYNVDRKYTKEMANWMETEIRKRYAAFREKVKPFEDAYNTARQKAITDRQVFKGGIFLQKQKDEQ